ncbi:iron dicitrate transport regulator FecR [Paraburkholderia acidicola]|uniref:FecR domain-containing protein n=1 Tax=Paraburkholderia acidicola TaxID=1912599 RepID=A0A2A4EPG2_9BURK|nr:FecR domain-containing protein [Paraburkholderia acidicola]PCE22322.1 iron dicitrate transport regulator FecR [Paraburkholderia acidicola]
MMRKAEVDSAASHALDEGSAWLLRLRSEKNVSPADAAAFQQWCVEHPQAAGLLRDTWGALGTAAAEVAREERAAGTAWTGEPDRTVAIRTGRRAFVGFAVAAGASWLALRPPMNLWPAVTDLSSDYRTGTGEQRRVTLSERVTVEMNTQTRLDVLPVSTATRGVELLAGEAEINAVAASPTRAEPARLVTVVAGPGRMQAQVARFNVRRTGDEVCVTCISGSVALDHPRGRVMLAADEQVVYDDRAVRPVSRVDPGAVIAWRRGVLVFNGVPVSEVVDEINRYRSGKVILRNAALGENRLQAQFPITRLDDVIDMLGRLYGAHVTKLPGKIVLLS